jgi:hypothetical protein
MDPPCIRGLKRFEKKGCPQKTWDGGAGCPAWIEEMVVDPGNPLKTKIEKKCLDLWMFTVAWNGNRLMEGTQQATESLRNGMCEEDPISKETVPKVDRGTLAVLHYISKQPKLIG